MYGAVHNINGGLKMRKYTKEIATILASMAISTAVTSNSASSEELIHTESAATFSESKTVTSYTNEVWDRPEYPVTTIPPLAGTIVASPPTTTSTTTTEAVQPYEDEEWETPEYPVTTIPPLAGTIVASPPTTTSTTTTEAVQFYEEEKWETPEYPVTTIPPLAGTMVASPPTTTSATTTEAVQSYEEEEWETPEYPVTTIPPLAGTMVASPPTPTDTETEPFIIPQLSDAVDVPNGDVNSDGETTLADALAILQYISNPSKYELSEDELLQADVFNPGDGITPMDALVIQKLDAGLYDSLPVIE